MIIEGNPKELAAMEQFHNGNRQAGLALQEEFAAAFREEYKEKDHCPCRKACRYQGMRRYPPRSSGTCAELHAAADQQEA